MRFELVSLSGEEPVAVPDVCAVLGISAERLPADQQVLIAQLISAARSIAEQIQARDLIVRQWRVYADTLDASQVFVRRPLLEVATHVWQEEPVEVEVAWSADGFVRPVSGAWPAPSGTRQWSYRFTGRSGHAPDDAWWSEAGATVRSAIAHLAAEMWLSRGTAADVITPALERMLSYGAAWRM